MNNKRQGTNFEYRVMRYLKRLGYYTVRHGRSQFPDIFSWKDKEIIGIECKSSLNYKDPSTLLSSWEKKEIEKLKDGIVSKFYLAYRIQMGKITKLRLVEI